MPHSHMVDEAVARRSGRSGNADRRERDPCATGCCARWPMPRTPGAGPSATAEEARQYAISDFARELLVVADNLQRTIAAAERHTPETVEDAALIEGVRATERILMHTLGALRHSQDRGARRSRSIRICMRR